MVKNNLVRNRHLLIQVSTKYLYLDILNQNIWQSYLFYANLFYTFLLEGQTEKLTTSINVISTLRDDK